MKLKKEERYSLRPEGLAPVRIIVLPLKTSSRSNVA